VSDTSPAEPTTPAENPKAAARNRLDARRVLAFVTGRWFVKTVFLALFVISCVQLFRFAAWIQGASATQVHRPESPAGLLPIGHFMSLFAWLRGGGWDALLPAGPVIILAAFATSLFFRRGFCGWICPVGTVWEGFSAAGRRIFGRNFRLPGWLDMTGRVLKFVLGAAFVGLLVTLPLSVAVNFRTLPFMWVADLKILNIMIQPVYLLIVLIVGVVSALIGPVWCRYACPLGGLYAAAGALSPASVTRDEDTCIQCGKCEKVCHAFCRPNAVRTVRNTECDGCMTCVKNCPVDGCLEAKALGKARIAPWVWPLLVVGLWLAIWGVAKVTGNWDTRVPLDGFRAAIGTQVSGTLSRPQ
jgi:polyferredoxin